MTARPRCGGPRDALMPAACGPRVRATRCSAIWPACFGRGLSGTWRERAREVVARAVRPWLRGQLAGESPRSPARLRERRARPARPGSAGTASRRGAWRRGWRGRRAAPTAGPRWAGCGAPCVEGLYDVLAGSLFVFVQASLVWRCRLVALSLGVPCTRGRGRGRDSFSSAPDARSCLASARLPCLASQRTDSITRRRRRCLRRSARRGWAPAGPWRLFSTGKDPWGDPGTSIGRPNRMACARWITRAAPTPTVGLEQRLSLGRATPTQILCLF